MTQSDEKKFNQTLRDLLKTPPKHHKHEKKSDKPPSNKKGLEQTRKKPSK